MPSFCSPWNAQRNHIEIVCWSCFLYQHNCGDMCSVVLDSSSAFVLIELWFLNMSVKIFIRPLRAMRALVSYAFAQGAQARGG